MNGWVCGPDAICTNPNTNVQGASGTPVDVRVSRDVTLLSPLIAALWGNTVTVTGDATMQLE